MVMVASEPAKVQQLLIIRPLDTSCFILTYFLNHLQVLSRTSLSKVCRRMCRAKISAENAHNNKDRDVFARTPSRRFGDPFCRACARFAAWLACPKILFLRFG